MAQGCQAFERQVSAKAFLLQPTGKALWHLELL